MHRSRLEDRYCVEEGTPWYGYHENPPLDDILQPKLLCPDIAGAPEFWKDETGDVVPRHTVYYIIPKNGVDIDELQAYLNSDDARQWLEANCQRAANGYLRLQSTVLKELPVPQKFADSYQETLV
jgi:hypothetical protein